MKRDFFGSFIIQKYLFCHNGMSDVTVDASIYNSIYNTCELEW